MKTLRLLSCIGFGLGLFGCQFGGNDDAAKLTLWDLSGFYTVDVELTPRLTFDIDGLTTDKSFSTTVTRGTVFVSADSDYEGSLFFNFTGTSFGEIEKTDWTFLLIAYDFHQLDWQSEPAYQLRSGTVSSRKLELGTIPLTKPLARWVKGANFTLETTFNLPISTLFVNIDKQLWPNIIQALTDIGYPPQIPVQLKIVTKNAVRED